MADQRDRRRAAAILVAAPAAEQSAPAGGSPEGWPEEMDARLRALARQHGGHLLAPGGPELAAAFASARHAVDAALAMLSLTEAPGEGSKGTLCAIAIRSAARRARAGEAGAPAPLRTTRTLQRQAAPGEVLVSDAVRQQAEGECNAVFEPRLPVQGPAGERLWRAAMVPEPQHFATPPGMEMSVAVLPFTDEAGMHGPEEAAGGGLAAGLAEDVIIGLSRFRQLRVIAHSAAAARVPRPLPAALAAFQLGVRYVVEGRVRRAPGQLRVTIGLADGRNGITLWNGHYDRAEGDGFETQDELAGAIVQTLAWQLDQLDGQRVRGRGGGLAGLSAQELGAMARSIVLDSPQALRRCRTLYQRACQADPDNAAALAGAALTYLVEWMSGWGRSRRETLGRALPLLRRAAGLDPLDAVVQRRLGVLSLFEGDPALAQAYLKRALMLNPNDGDTHAFHALFHICRGNPGRGLEELAEAVAANPFHPSYYYWFIGLAHYMQRRYADGLLPLRKAIGLYPNFPAPHWHAAACHGQLGHAAEAAGERRRILEAAPGATIRRITRALPFERASDLAHYCDGLRRAGLPE
ncbi:adenylate cyclase Cya3 [Cribrihabitans neustonicus]|uniref:adenylate cyclase Cya3 n=1 Tax=Cribrihabitans neustonicus TaxID=1429085 RepID=UPI003B594A75